MAIYRIRKGEQVKISNAEIKKTIMKAHGFTTSKQYENYYDTMRNKRRAMERFIQAQGAPIDKQSIQELLYREALTMTREGSAYKPSSSMVALKSFSSISTGKAGQKITQGKRYQQRMNVVILNEVAYRFGGLIDKNPTAREIFDKLQDNPIKLRQALIDFATRMHAQIDMTSKGEAIPNGEVVGSDTFSSFNVDMYID